MWGQSKDFAFTGRGSGAAGAQGPRFRFRWCLIWLGLRPGSGGAPVGLRRGSGGAPALLRRGAGLDRVRPSSPLPTRENLPPALTPHLPWPEQGAPTHGHTETGEQTDGHVDAEPAQDLGSDLGLGEKGRSGGPHDTCMVGAVLSRTQPASTGEGAGQQNLGA